MDIKRLLEDYKNGKITIEQAEDNLKHLPYEDIDFCKIDFHRSMRSGYPEVIFGLGKTPEQVRKIVDKMLERENENILITKADKAVFNALKDIDKLTYHEDCGIIHILKKEITLTDEYVAVISGGTGDIPVCKEAVHTLYAMGVSCKEVYDIGVAGIHRLLDKTEDLQGARVIIAAAGMEGALPTVVAGLTSCPVIGVPTSIGYGASLSGLAPLLTMVNSCANRVCVVNIDNGYGAACVAAAIVGGKK
ncbi:MAG: nickel pincer cofactor biosynthesis protein LarB [Clostridia bacterium]|nr:nickel pincer cofactor biosynthesis protein LarB [Clostridia bacterium]